MLEEDYAFFSRLICLQSHPPAFDPFLFIKNKPIYIIRGFLLSWEKSHDILSEGNAAHPVGCDSPLQIVMAVWHFVSIQTFWVGCDSPLPTIMVHQTTITFCRGLSQPTRSLSRIVCRGQGGGSTLKAEKAFPGLISRPILDLGFFKANVTTRYRKTVVRKSRYS